MFLTCATQQWLGGSYQGIYKSELSSRCQPLNHEETGPTSNCALYHGEVVRPGPTNTGFVTVMAESSAGKEQRNGVGNVIALTFLVIASTMSDEVTYQTEEGTRDLLKPKDHP